MGFVVYAELVLGLIVLAVGAEVLVRGAARLAAAMGVSPLVVGLTVVAFGTSAPELTVSLAAALSGAQDMAVANVVGSNILNVLLILGLSALIVPLTVHRQVVRREVPIMIAVTIVAWVMALDGLIGKIDAGILFAGVVAYTAWTVYASRRERIAPDPELLSLIDSGEETSRWWGTLKNLAFVAAGLVMLVLGSWWLVDAATSIARALGVSDVVIGLTVVAVGTSLPELATTVVAALRKQTDMAVGNIVGSNLFNLLSILGVAGLVTPGGLNVAEALLRFDFIIMFVSAAACLPVFFTGLRISRWEGGLFFAGYVTYTTYLIAQAAEGEPVPWLSIKMAIYLAPLTALTVFVAVRGLFARRWRLPSHTRKGL
jgi:cation:H+ antiporter